jgi:putative ABC transport system ATP-binding protein
MSDHFPDWKEFKQQFVTLLKPESAFYQVVLVYSLAISLLTLAVPLSVQLLVDTVANIALPRAVFLIAGLLFALLFFSGVMYALRTYAMELFSRRLYARISSEIAMTAMLAESDYFEEHQQADLFNRYFDIVTLKKTLPSILTNGFTLLLQAIIGFTVVSFYHFYLFIYCLALIALIWLIWLIWGWAAINTGFRLSQAKYDTASWLQSLAVTNESYRTTHNPAYAIEETNRLIDNHIDCQKRHFRHTFSQLLSFLFLYASASGVLLGVGGYLVIAGELTLGQLVAAELIMLSILVGLPQLAGYLDSFYDACAAVEEISRFRGVETQLPTKASAVAMPADTRVVFKQVAFSRFGRTKAFDFVLPANAMVRVSGNPISLKWLAELLRGNYQPSEGLITIGDIDNLEIDRQALRVAIKVIDRVTLLPMTISDYLDLFIEASKLGGESYSKQQALTALGLDEDIARLHGGLKAKLSRSGWPLTQPQAIRLKLASALLAQPKILVLGDIVDSVNVSTLQATLERLKKLGTTVLYYSKRQDVQGFTHALEIDSEVQSLITYAQEEK